MSRQRIVLLIVVLCLAGCGAPQSVRPRIDPVSEARLGLDSATPVIHGDWWAAYGDPQLDRLVTLGLADNPSLDAALARVESASAEIAVNEAGLMPHLHGSVQVDRSRIGDKLLPEPIGGPAGTLFLAGASLEWDLDLFGRQHALVRSAEARAQAMAYDAQAARLTISVSIAQTYVSLARAVQQIKVAEDIVATRQRSLAWVQSRRHANLAPDIEVQANETLLAQAQQAVTRAARDRDTLIHALAAIVGRGADFYGEVHAPTLALDHAPDVPEVLPADLLGRRPDLLAARARINSAVDTREAAAAAFMPDINITALAGLASFGIGNFLKSGAGSYAAGPALSLPIFEGGRLRAQYKASTADLDASVAAYNEAVLAAVRESADAVSNVRASDEDLSEQMRVVVGLRNVVRFNRVRVSTGLDSNLDAVDSGFRLLEAEQDLVRLQANTLITRIQLVAALGGGFSRDTAASPLTSKD